MGCRQSTSERGKNNPLFLYKNQGKTLIEAYKFGNNRSLSKLFAELLYTYRLKDLHGYTVVPVPASHTGVAKRGWDQVDLICSTLWNTYGIPYKNLLQRTRSDQKEQKQLDREERKKHSKNIFSLREECVNQRIILLDDIATTGATLDICYKLLYETGAAHIILCTLAQV